MPLRGCLLSILLLGTPVAAQPADSGDLIRVLQQLQLWLNRSTGLGGRTAIGQGADTCQRHADHDRQGKPSPRSVEKHA